jgi:hypothetical protein
MPPGLLARGRLRPRSATFVLKPEVADKPLHQRYSITGCTLWRQSQFGSKHSHVSTPRRQT